LNHRAVPCDTEAMPNLIRPLIIAALPAILSCAPPVVSQHRVVVVAAHAPADAAEPIPGATVRVECPKDVEPPATSEVSANEIGEAVLTVGIPSTCVLVVESAGWVERRFRVADTCLQRREEPFVCDAGVAVAALVVRGPWGDTDADSAAAALANECFVDPTWAGDSKPSIRINRLINKTDEHIDLRVVANRILDAAVENPGVRVLETDYSAEAPAADYLLNLEITSIVEMPLENLVARTYTIFARVIRAADKEVVCQSTHKRKKQQFRPKTTW
jgi:hypothetical protein